VPRRRQLLCCGPREQVECVGIRKGMFVVIFEVHPKKERWDDYLSLAKQLKPKLEAIDGFIDNERFGSKKTKGTVLSLSTWRDEKAVVRWRTQGEHHSVQEKGRSVVFEDYHLRVGEITADSHPPKGLAVEEQHFDETDVGDAKTCTITEVSRPHESNSGPQFDAILAHLQFDPRADRLVDCEVFESITSPGKLLILGAWRDRSAAEAWKPLSFNGAGEIRHREVRIIRDYGMFERREAPQYFPGVERTSFTKD
jgi:heme-degrading monooxygenase HmoA